MTRTALSTTILLGAAIATTIANPANAQVAPEAPPPVDVVIHTPPRPHRSLLLEWNPLTLFLERFSLNVVVAPGDHHALVLSPFYTWASTVPYATGIDYNGNPLPQTLNVLSQTFQGLGGDLGYRYYFERGGPRGFFVGPSLILAGIDATAGNGKHTGFLDYGLAADAGFQALLADTVSISAGVGIQYCRQTVSIPPQQLPASVVANEAVQARFLLSIGYAL